jgi:TrmH family RNA methyltransferase
VALVLGNEAHGLPDEIAADLDQVARVPLTGRAESLNLAAAAAVLLYEAARQQAREGTTVGR